MEAASSLICCLEAKTWCRIVGVAQAIAGFCALLFGIYAVAVLRAPGGLYYVEEEAKEASPTVMLATGFVFVVASGLSFTVGSLLYTATMKEDRSLLRVWIASAVFLKLTFFLVGITMFVMMKKFVFLVILLLGIFITAFSIYVVVLFRKQIQVKASDDGDEQRKEKVAMSLVV